jgi:type I restriction enzyme S subunit
MKWRDVELGEIAEVSTGDGAPQEESAFGESGTPFIRAGSLAKLLEGTKEEELELISKHESSQRRMRTYPAQTIVFAKSGMSCTKGLIYELKGSALVVNHLAALVCGDDLDHRFLLRWFEVNSPARLIANPSYPSIKISDIRSEKIPLPPLAEQKRIAAILDAADALRTQRRESLAQLDALLQSTFLTLFGDPVTNPMGWAKPPLLELCSAKQWPTISGSQLEKSGYPVYGANGQIGYYSKYNHEHPTVLVTCRGATCGTINICPPKCYVTGNAMALDDPDPKRITLNYLEWVLRIRGMNDVICGAAQPQITRTGMAPITIPLPPLPLQQKFAAIVESIERQKAAQRAHLAELDALFAALQHRAFRGEL